MYQRIGGWVAHVSSYIFKVLYLFYFEKKKIYFFERQIHRHKRENKDSNQSTQRNTPQIISPTGYLVV